MQYKTSKYLFQFKDTEHGCGAKKSCERVISFDIPEVDPDFPKGLSDVNYSLEDQPLLKRMNGSVNGHMFNVLYSLKVFVRHDAITQIGEGECLTVPIRIYEIPQP